MSSIFFPKPKPPILSARWPGLAFQTGVVAWVPLPPDEVEHYSAWKPLMRVPVQSGELAQTALDTFPKGWPIILLVETLNDGLVNEIADRLAVAGRTDVYVELMNEQNGIVSPRAANAFYLRSIARLNGIVTLDHTITCGVANIEPPAVRWVKDSLPGIPTEVLVGFHAYANFIKNRAAFVDVLGGRFCAMTEGGSFNLEPDWSAAVDRINREWQAIYEMPCAMGIWYQHNDGTEANQKFGLHDQFTGTWRAAAEQALIAARRA